MFNMAVKVPLEAGILAACRLLKGCILPRLLKKVQPQGGERRAE
jgi:hypothetical protein